MMAEHLVAGPGEGDVVRVSGSRVMPTHAQGHFERYKCLTRFGIEVKEKGGS